MSKYLQFVTSYFLIYICAHLWVQIRFKLSLNFKIDGMENFVVISRSRHNLYFENTPEDKLFLLLAWC